MTRRRVLHVLNSGDIGGVERLAIDLVAVQKADPALEVGLFFLQSPAGDFAPEFHGLGVPLHTMNLSSGSDLSPRKWRAAVAVLRQYDLIHVHVFNPQLALAAVRAGRPVIYTVHGLLGHGRRMRLSDRVNDQLLRWFLNRHCQLVTCNSRATEALARRRYGLEGVPAAVIYNGIALPPPGAPAGVDEDTARRIAGRFVVGTSTRFAGFKRIDRLVDGFALFARRHPEARLLLVGDGALRGQIEAQVQRLGIGGQTIFTGFRANVRAYQQAMSVCVFPSEAEPFGLVSVEALALGKPVIVFADGGGMVEVVAPCAAADVVDGVEGLAARLEHYAAHPAEIAGGAAARREHAARFDIARTAADFSRQYQAMPSCAA